MGKITLQELAGALVERRNMGKKQASQFVNEMFVVIQKALDQDKLVKVKGLGTFRIIDVEDRESVNVNTGDRVLIEGHGKITFTADSLMKELVNKPFSQFETVVLKDGVDFEDNKEPEPEQTPDVSSEVVTESHSGNETFSEDELFDNPSMIPLVDFTTVTVDDTAIKSKADVSNDINEVCEIKDAVDTEKCEVEENVPDNVAEENVATKEVTEEDAAEDIIEDSSGGRSLKWPVIAITACVLGFAVGFMTAKYASTERLLPQETVSKTNVAAPIKVEAEKSKAMAVAPVAQQPETIAADREEPQKQDAKEKTTPVKEVETTPVKETEADPVKEKAVTDADHYEQKDIRIRTGAYRIVGVDHVEKVRAADNLTRICKRTLGPGMECYLEVFNGITSKTSLKQGQEIKIPKLQLKKKKPQKQN